MIPEIIEVMNLGVHPHSLYEHCRKHMKLNLRIGKSQGGRAHRGEETGLSYINKGVNYSNYKPHVKTKN